MGSFLMQCVTPGTAHLHAITAGLQGVHNTTNLCDLVAGIWARGPDILDALAWAPVLCLHR